MAALEGARRLISRMRISRGCFHKTTLLPWQLSQGRERLSGSASPFLGPRRAPRCYEVRALAQELALSWLFSQNFEATISERCTDEQRAYSAEALADIAYCLRLHSQEEGKAVTEAHARGIRIRQRDLRPAIVDVRGFLQQRARC